MSSNWGHLTTKVVIKTKYLKKVLHLFCLFYKSNEAFYSCCLPRPKTSFVITYQGSS